MDSVTGYDSVVGIRWSVARECCMISECRRNTMESAGAYENVGGIQGRMLHGMKISEEYDGEYWDV